MSLTFGEIRKFVEENKHLPNDTPVFTERVKDRYFDGYTFNNNIVSGWDVEYIEGWHYYCTKERNEEMLKEIKRRKKGKKPHYPGIENPQDYIIELNNDSKEQFYRLSCMTKNDSRILFYAHY